MQSPMEIARGLLGAGEVPDRATLQEFMANGGQNLDPVTTAWCAAFVNASLGQAGIQGTNALNARSFLDWGQAVDAPQRGDIAVFSRGDPNSWQGHVGFFDGYNQDGTIRVLGGNQGDAVSLANYSPDTLLGFRRAPQTGNALAGMVEPQEPVNALAQAYRPPMPQFQTMDVEPFLSKRSFV